MSLFIDSDQVTLTDLVAIDPEVTDVAVSEAIIVEGAGSVIRNTWTDCKSQLMGGLQTIAGNQFVQAGSTVSILTGGFGNNTPRVQASQIVMASGLYDATDSPLKTWMTYKAIRMFYRAASNRKVKDRYAQKRDDFAQDEARYWRILLESGIPMVAMPLAAPGAIHDHQAGTWGALNVDSVAGGASSPTTYQVAITWVDSSYNSPASTNNGESGPSAILSFAVPSANYLRVNITGLNPPGSVMYNWGIADGARLSRAANRWNVYVGAASGPLYLQNVTPISIGTATYTFAAAPVLSGYQLQPGQAPDRSQAWMRALTIG